MRHPRVALAILGGLIQSIDLLPYGLLVVTMKVVEDAQTLAFYGYAAVLCI